MNKSNNTGCLTIILTILFFPIAIPLLLITNTSSSNNNKKEETNLSGYSDEELIALGLLDDEREAVKRGECDPSDFYDDF